MLKVANSVISASRITGVLPVVNGGTGVTTSTGTGNTVLSATPTLSGDVTLSTGNLVIGTSGKGIDFSVTSQVGGMTSELFADYEEGTWTPVVTSGSGTITTLGAVSGTYTKIGRLAVVNFSVAITTNGTGGSFISIEVPFTALANQAAVGVFKEVNVNGGLGSVILNGATSFLLQTSVGLYPGVDGCKLVGTISYPT